MSDDQRTRRAQAAWGGIRRFPAVGSIDIIRYLSLVCGATPEVAAAVIDGFWACVTDPANYRPRGYLVIPHFGTFRLRSGGTVLAFRSRRTEELRGRVPVRKGLFFTRLVPDGAPPAGRWVRHAGASSAASPRLSIKRRLAVSIAGWSGVPVVIVYDLLWTMLELLVAVFCEKRQRVSWARRGTMKPARSGLADYYVYRRRLSHIRSFDAT